MSQHKNHAVPVALPTAEDELSFKSCCTELFRWVRAGIELAEESPSFVKSLADDLCQAWEDSAKK